MGCIYKGATKKEDLCVRLVLQPDLAAFRYVLPPSLAGHAGPCSSWGPWNATIVVTCVPDLRAPPILYLTPSKHRPCFISSAHLRPVGVRD